MRILVVSAWEPWRLDDGSCLILHHHLAQLHDRHDIRLLCAGAPSPAVPLAAAHPPGTGAPRDGGWTPGHAATAISGGAAATTPGPAVRGARVPDGVLPPGVTGAWCGTSRFAGTDFVLRKLRSGRSGEPSHVHWVERPALLAALAGALRQHDPEVIHLFGWGTAGLVRHLDGRPAVHVAVDPWAANVANRRLAGARRLAGRERRRVERHERRYYPRCSAVVVVSPRDAARLRHAVPEARIEVIGNGVEPGPQPPPAAARPPVVIFHGNLSAEANVAAARTLITQVLGPLRTRVPDARLVIAGRRPPTELRRLGATGLDVLADPTDIRALLDRAAASAVPLTSGAGVHNKVLEAMAAGLPVAGTALALDGIGEGPGLRLVQTPAELVEVLAHWLVEPESRELAGRANRAKAIGEFSWAASAAAVERLWRSVAA